MTGLLALVQAELELTTRRLGLALSGAVLLLVGVALFSVAGWMWLAQWKDPLFATTVIAGLYFVLGLVLLLLSRRYSHLKRRPVVTPGVPATGETAGVPPTGAFWPMGAASLASAFVTGFRAGSKN